VTGERLRGRCEERLGELLRLEETLGELVPADLTGALVVLPAGAGDVPADHALERDHVGLADEERPSGGRGGAGAVREP
jgi:hypothetical protein